MGGLIEGRIDCYSSTVQASYWSWRVAYLDGVNVVVFIAVRCQRLMDRSASLIATALMSFAFGVVATKCQHFIVRVKMYRNGVLVLRQQGASFLLCASLCFATAAFLSLIELVDAPLVELIELSWVVVDWPRLLASCFNLDATLGRYAVVMKDWWRYESIVVAVRCKRLVDRSASLTAMALMSSAFGVIAVRCQLFVDHNALQ